MPNVEYKAWIVEEFGGKRVSVVCNPCFRLGREIVKQPSPITLAVGGTPLCKRCGSELPLYGRFKMSISELATSVMENSAPQG